MCLYIVIDVYISVAEVAEADTLNQNIINNRQKRLRLQGQCRDDSSR